MSLLILFNPHGPDLPIHLDGRATYIEGEASQPTILVQAYFYNPEEDTYKPQFVDSGTATLIRGGIHEIQTIEFDKRFGNSDGAFYFQFSHPPISTNLTVRIVADLSSMNSGGSICSTHLDRTITVLHENEDPIPLSSQTDTSGDVNDELRSKKRKDEELL